MLMCKLIPTLEKILDLSLLLIGSFGKFRFSNLKFLPQASNSFYINLLSSLLSCAHPLSFVFNSWFLEFSTGSALVFG